jgi:transposase InsO family protein
VQFTCEAFIVALVTRGIRISMDGKGRCLDNIFCERLWCSLKYEDVYLKAYKTVAQAKAGKPASARGSASTTMDARTMRWITPRRASFCGRRRPVDMWTTQARCPHPNKLSNKKQEIILVTKHLNLRINCWVWNASPVLPRT